MNAITRSALALAALAAPLALGACARSTGAGPAPVRRAQSEPPLAGAPAADPGFIRLWAETFRFTLGEPTSFKLTPDGWHILYLRSGPRSRVRDLYELDVASGQERVLLTADQVLQGGEENLTAEELARRERMRLTARGISGYELSKDGAKILINLSNRLFVIDRATGAKQELASAAGGAPIDARFSPDGSMVSAVRDGELYVTDIASGQERKLTTDATPDGKVTNALAEFVAQEEMGRFEGYWWSPDSRAIAYQQTNVSALEVMTISDPTKPEVTPQSWPYPRPGKANAVVRLGVVAASGGETRWFEWDRSQFEYLATVKWPRASASGEPGPVVALLQNREQTEQTLLAIDPSTGAMTPLLTERDDAWLNLEQIAPLWLSDGSGFLWVTERRGAWQLEHRLRDGGLVRVLTPLDFGLQELVAVDEEAGDVYVKASKDPAESHLFRVPLAEDDRIEQLTFRPGLHGAVFSKDHSTWVHTLASLDGENSAVVRRGGEALATIPSRVELPPWQANIELTTVGGDPGWRCVVIRPRNFDPGRRYPVINSVYGGPHHQTVLANRRRYLLQQWLADHGYIVVSIDARGTPGKGRDWERAIKGDLISLPLEEQIEAMRLLARRYPEMDLERVGMFGWSFGGYFSAHAALQRPDFFDAAVAGAPVTDWADYDTHYTERYMGLPERNAAGYERSNALVYADRPGPIAPLLLIHGTADDNVYFMHALKLADRLLRTGKPFEFIPLAGFTHVVVDPVISARMYERVLAFFEEHLKGPAPSAASPTATRASVATGGLAQPGCYSGPREEAKQLVESTLDALHRAAAEADEDSYFGLFTPEAVFLGTDPGERWTLEEFRAFAAPYFDRDSAWTYRVIDRRVFFDPTLQAAWFEETLENAKLGECRGSGALRPMRDDAGAWRWGIAQYNLTIPVPNDITADVVDRIRAWRADGGASAR